MPRIADQTSLAGARVLSSDRMVAIGLFPAVVRFEPVAFGIMDEGGVIMRPVILAQPWLAVVAPAMLHRRHVERLHAFLARRGEAEVEPRVGVFGNGALRLEDPEARGLFAVAERRLVGTQTRESKRLQRRIVKRLGLRDVANADRNVIEHECLLL